MSYQLMLRARPRPDESSPEKHERLSAHLRSIGAPWVSPGGRWPRAKDAGTQPMSVVSLRGVLGRGLKGAAHYQNRKHLPDEAEADDWVSIEFDPAKVDYGSLVGDVFPGLVAAFGAYVGSVADEAFTLHDFDAWRRSGIDDRHGVFRIYPTHFFGRALCRQAFDLTPRQVVGRLSGEVERAEVHSGGALVIVSSSPLPFARAKAIDRRIRPLLRT